MTRPGLSESLAIVLLAAGGSTRLGQPKQLVPVDGEALVLRTARSLLRLEPAAMLVVTGCDSDRVKEQLAGLPLQIVHNAEWKEGMGTSIACGVKNLPERIGGVLIMLCDQWRVNSADLKRLFEAWNTDISDIVAARWKNGKTFIFSPPAIFSGSLFHELENLTGDQGAKRIIEEFKGKTTFVEMENAAFDVDEKDDLKSLTGE
jgi:molybdenum cofactor cytidylyltransferase